MKQNNEIIKFSKGKIIVSLLIAVILIIIIMVSIIVDCYDIFITDYLGEYDIQYVNTDNEQDWYKFSDIMTYDEYIDFCEAWNLEINYTEENCNYIIHAEYTPYYTSGEVRLGNISYDSDDYLQTVSYVSLYILEDENTKSINETYNIYFVFIPTSNEVDYVTTYHCDKISEILLNVGVEGFASIICSIVFLTICIFFIIGVIKNIINNKRCWQPNKHNYIKLIILFVCLVGLILLIWNSMWIVI